MENSISKKLQHFSLKIFEKMENRKIGKSWISIEIFRKSKNREKLDFNWFFSKNFHLENVSKNIFITQLFEIYFFIGEIFFLFSKIFERSRYERNVRKRLENCSRSAIPGLQVKKYNLYLFFHGFEQPPLGRGNQFVDALL